MRVYLCVQRYINMHVCIYICMNVYEYVCMHVYIRMHACVHVCMCACVCIERERERKKESVCMNVCMYCAGVFRTASFRSLYASCHAHTKRSKSMTSEMGSFAENDLHGQGTLIHVTYHWITDSRDEWVMNSTHECVACIALQLFAALCTMLHAAHQRVTNSTLYRSSAWVTNSTHEIAAWITLQLFFAWYTLLHVTNIN